MVCKKQVTLKQSKYTILIFFYFMLIKLSDVAKYSHTETLMKVKTEVVLVCFLGAASFSSRQTWSFLLISTLGDQIPSIHLFTKCFL